MAAAGWTCARAVTPLEKVPSDLDVAHSVTPLPIGEIAKATGLLASEVAQYGEYAAKISLKTIDRLRDAPLSRYVVVTALTPTAYGEGKSTTTIGLAQALGCHFGKRAIACVRQPSQGPIFGIKGGAAGGGYAQIVPMEDFNLHLTGDLHAISAANNLLAAAIDTRIFHEATQKDDALFKRLTTDDKGRRNFTPAMLTRLAKLGIPAPDHPDALTPEQKSRFARLGIVPSTVSWRRVVDCNDRALRGIHIGLGREEAGKCERDTGFDITAASEVMAITALATDLADLRARLGRIVVAQSTTGEDVTAEDIGCAGAMCVLLRDALRPNLMQTLEATPVLVHCGPFGNIAHGNSSIVADLIATRIATGPDGEEGIVLTEAGFGADLGFEKFVNIKCRASGLRPSAAVVVATLRAIRAHDPTPPPTGEGDIERGAANLCKHVANVRALGLAPVVVINAFVGEGAGGEYELVERLTLAAGAAACVTSEHWAKGGGGAVAAARAVWEASAAPPSLRFTYELGATLKEKFAAIVTSIYGGVGCSFSPLAESQIAAIEARGFGGLPVCMAKTQYSLSHNEKLKGAPTGFTVPINEVYASVGAGFVYALLGPVNRMPGLPTRPAYYHIDVDPATGEVFGLS